MGYLFLTNMFVLYYAISCWTRHDGINKVIVAALFVLAAANVIAAAHEFGFMVKV